MFGDAFLQKKIVIITDSESLSCWKNKARLFRGGNGETDLIAHVYKFYTILNAEIPGVARC